MVLSFVTIYAIAFSCFTLFIGKAYAVTPLPVKTTGQYNRRGMKINLQNYVIVNESLDITEKSAIDGKENYDWERQSVIQNYFLPLNVMKMKKMSNSSIRHFNESQSFLALLDTTNNVTEKINPFHSGNNSPSTLIRYLDSVNNGFMSKNNIKISVKNSKWNFAGKIKNFVAWDTLQDSEKEVRVHYNGIIAKETVVKTGIDQGTGKRQGLKLRQLTDGTRFIQLIYTFDNEIQDCEYIRQKKTIEKFLSTFKDDVEKAKATYEIEKDEEKSESVQNRLDEDEGEYYLEEDEGKIERYFDDGSEDYEKKKNYFGNEYRNVTFQIIRRYEDIPKELSEWMNYSMLKQKCRENHRIMKRLVYDKKHGDKSTKKLAEEHIERKKRDIMDVLLVPGTKWCGKGRRATKYTSLGGFSRTDKCCRLHDTMCPHWIGSLEEKYGLFNWRINTIMHCRCDKRFRACLKMAKTGTANFVGKLFFNVVQTKCFVLKPQEVCLKYSWWGTCEKTEYRKKAYLKDNLSY